MDTIHSIGIVAVASIVTAAIRFIPFVLFPENKQLPKVLIFLSNVLPASVMGMLLVYCFRNTNVSVHPFALPEIIASAVVAASYVWKRNILVSIATGTVLYMILVQFVF